MSDRRFDPVAHAREMRAGGYWIDKTYDEFLVAEDRRHARQAGDASPTAPTATGRDASPIASSATWSPARPRRCSRLGVGHGDVVSVQLPNWWEFVVIALACARVGAVVNPLMPIFREHELSYMLDFAESKVFIVPKTLPRLRS